MPKDRREKAVVFGLQRIRPSRLRPSLPPTLRHRPPHPVPASLSPPAPSPVTFKVTFPTVAPPRLLRSPSPRFSRFPFLHHTPPCLALPASAALPVPPFRSPPPSAPPPLSSRPLSPERPHSPLHSACLSPASRASCDTLAPSHAMLPASSAAAPLLAPSFQFSPLLPLLFPLSFTLQQFFSCCIYKCRIFY